MSSTDSSGRLTVVRWLVALVLLAVVGLVGFVAFTRYGRPPPAAAGSSQHDARLDAFLARADERLLVGDLDGAKEQYFKASGLSDKDPRVAQGLARVEVQRAELAFWRWLVVADAETEDRDAAELALTRAARGASDAVDQAVDKAPADPASLRLQNDRLRVEAMVVYALARAGKRETADKNLDQLATHHRSHPLLEALRKLVESAAQPREPRAGDDEEAPDASAEGSAKPGAPRSTVEHFEFDHEPVPPVKTPGELEIPVTPGESKLAPQPTVDTSDL